MSRFEQIREFIEYDFGKNKIIEPENRLENVKERLFEIINTYNPEVIVKAGMGSGDILMEMASEFDTYIVVVEPSFSNVSNFCEKFKDNKDLEKIRFIIGDFNHLPVDYYAADMLLSIDNLNFVDSGRVIDEFRRALEFDGVLFLATVVLHDDDMEGVYDDFIRNIFPLHNEYYLADELKTVFDLNEFKFIRGNYEYFNEDTSRDVEFFNEFYDKSEKNPAEFLEEHKDVFTSLYKMDRGVISLPYYSGVFMRIKPDSIKGVSKGKI